MKDYRFMVFTDLHYAPSMISADAVVGDTSIAPRAKRKFIYKPKEKPIKSRIFGI